MPAIITPECAADSSADALIRRFREHFDTIRRVAAERGAVLFRGFELRGRASFDDFARTATQPLAYVHGNSPRSRLTDAVYTSTEFPAAFAISFHNELSYCATWPRYLLFFCSLPAKVGGETPLVDSAALYQALPTGLRTRFEERGLLYIRNLNAGNGFGPSWMKTFATTSRERVEELCLSGGVRFAWKPDGSLRLWERRPATRVHPDTGERVWFNQADQFHPSNHPPDVRRALSEYYKGREQDMPHYCLHADGSALDADELELIRETARTLSHSFTWQEGDLLLVDNMKTAHGRNPYEGAREILVSMF